MAADQGGPVRAKNVILSAEILASQRLGHEVPGIGRYPTFAMSGT